MKKKIMAVDDEPDQTYTLKQLFKRYCKEYDLITVNSGIDCMEFLENNPPPDLILLDIMMPGMSGWQVFDRLKDNPLWKNIPVFFLTARRDDLTKKVGDYLGDDYIEKPFDLKDLKRRIDQFLLKNN